MGVFAAFGMAARRWYLLLPLVLLSAGAAWLAYIQMPATYAASAVYQVGVQPASGGRPVASTPQVNTAQVAGLLIGRMQGGANGGPTASTYTVSGRPGSSIITVSAQGDNPGQALDRVAAGHTRLGAQLTALQTERVVQTDGDLRLQATTPPTASAPIRTTGIKVFLVTLLFGSMLSLVFAAAVERSARRRRSLREQAEADAPTEVVAKIEAEPVSASDAHRTSAMATHDDVREPEPEPEPELEPQPEPEPESEPDDAGAYSARATPAGERTGEGTHALRAPSSGEGTHALRMAPPPEEEPVRGPAPAESAPATVAAAATSAIPVGTNDEVSSDASV
ncbi:MAG: hypothetical protein J2P19_31450, partial [Pseudonocardia sp.]|nr:hypothetical protein [Pseudonocardia sp.]